MAHMKERIVIWNWLNDTYSVQYIIQLLWTRKYLVTTTVFDKYEVVLLWHYWVNKKTIIYAVSINGERQVKKRKFLTVHFKPNDRRNVFFLHQCVVFFINVLNKETCLRLIMCDIIVLKT